MESFLELPAHPLFVHAPVVLMPITAMLAALFMVRRDFRRRFSSWFAALSGGLLVMTVMATQSGEAFDKALKGLAPIDRHEALAETTQYLVLALFVVAVAQAIMVRRESRPGRSTGNETAKKITTGLAAAVLTFSLLGSVWMARTGHEGAKAVWDGTIKKKP
jgi:uncharacterized membrane protein